MKSRLTKKEGEKLRIAENLFEAGRLAEALGLFKEILPGRSTDSILKRNIAVCLYNMGNRSFDGKNWREAIDCYEEALAIDPGYHDPYSNLGLAYGYLANHEKAIPNLLKAIESEPTDPNPYLTLGLIYWDLGKWSDAKPLLERFLTLAPESRNRDPVKRLLSAHS